MANPNLRTRVAFFGAIVLLGSAHLRASTYLQTNLTSSIPGLAANTDPNLINPWGMSFSPTSPFWISDQGTNNSTLYNGLGVPNALVVGVQAGPTGTVFNGTPGFVEGDGTAASFLFATLSGNIDAWNGADGTTAEVMHNAAGAVYTGLASDPSSQRLFAANFATGGIDVYDSTFSPITAPGGFTDPNLPAGFAPYNIQQINGQLYVEYAGVDPQTGRALSAPGAGLVDVFDTDGNLLKRLVSGGHLDAPWGVTLAPAGFGGFGGDLLVGNFGDGTINAYNPTTGAFEGTLVDASGKALVNSGLWAIAFRTGGPSVDTNTLYFNAGLNDETAGLFGAISPIATPEPATLAGGLLGLALVISHRVFAKRR